MLRPIANPVSRFDPREVVWEIPPDLARLTVYEDATRSVLSRNESPDLWFRWSLNPYRGCMHACAYCYARPTHEYLGLGAGTDHDTRILVKPRAPELLREHFEREAWVGETVLFSGNTDCYQPLEYRWQLTRGCLEVCLAYRNPVAVITKAALIERDVDLLAALAREARVQVVFSIPFWDPEVARAIEPGTPPPRRRVEAMRRLHDAGVPVAVNVAPVIPGLNDRDIPAILNACAEAGARHAAMILVRLPGPVEAVFTERLQAALPTRAEGVLSRLARAREGRMQEGRFGERMRGHGEEWAATKRLFELTCRRLGLQTHAEEASASPEFADKRWDHEGDPTTFRRPGRGRQIGLFR